MTTPSGSGPKSMRFEIHEVLSGMLAGMQDESFTDDVSRLAAMFENLAGRFTLFAPMAAGVDPGAVARALERLERNKIIEHGEGRYVLTPEGRALCVSSKKTLFNRRDIQELDEAATVFDSLKRREQCPFTRQSEAPVVRATSIPTCSRAPVTMTAAFRKPAGGRPPHRWNTCF